MPTTKTAALDLDSFVGFTPGPWTYDNIPGMDGRGFPAHLHRIAGKWNIPVVWLDCRHANDQPDARLIAAAPALLAECRRLRAENQRLRDALQSVLPIEERKLSSLEKKPYAIGLATVRDRVAKIRAALEPQS